MRAVVTGITGFIGSHLAETLIAHGDQVLGLGGTGQWREDTPRELVEHCTVDCWDIVEPVSADVEAKIRQFAPDCVFHFAGISIPSRCGHPRPTPEAIAVNVGGTRHVLDLVLSLPSRPKLIFSSSCHVYAAVDPRDPYVTEDSPLNPTSGYGQTKVQCESLIQEQTQSSDLRACIVRGFHHIGPRQPRGLMLTDWLHQLADPTCTKLTVKSTQSYLDLIDVRDAVQAYRRLAEHEPSHGVYNLGSGQFSQSGAVLQTVLNLMGSSVEVAEESSIPRWNAIADIRKLKSLGWQPVRNYRDTVAAMIADI